MLLGALLQKKLKRIQTPPPIEPKKLKVKNAGMCNFHANAPKKPKTQNKKTQHPVPLVLGTKILVQMLHRLPPPPASADQKFAAQFNNYFWHTDILIRTEIFIWVFQVHRAVPFYPLIASQKSAFSIPWNAWVRRRNLIDVSKNENFLLNFARLSSAHFAVHR